MKINLVPTLGLKQLLLATFFGVTTLTACSSETDGEDANQAALTGDAERGRALANSSSCASCHEADYGGAGFFPNITPDAKYGIGSWTDAQIGKALVTGTDEDGDELCSLMERFPFSNQQVVDVIAYLRSLPPVARANQSECP